MLVLNLTADEFVYIQGTGFIDLLSLDDMVNLAIDKLPGVVPCAMQQINVITNFTQRKKRGMRSQSVLVRGFDSAQQVSPTRLRKFGSRTVFKGLQRLEYVRTHTQSLSGRSLGGLDRAAALPGQL